MSKDEYFPPIADLPPTFDEFERWRLAALPENELPEDFSLFEDLGDRTTFFTC